MRSNLRVNRTARKLRSRVPSALRASAAGYARRLGVERFIQPHTGLKHVDMPVTREKVWRAWHRH